MKPKNADAIPYSLIKMFATLMGLMRITLSAFRFIDLIRILTKTSLTGEPRFVLFHGGGRMETHYTLDELVPNDTQTGVGRAGTGVAQPCS